MFIRTEKSIRDFLHFYPIVSTLIIVNIALYLIVYVIPLPAIELLNQCTFGFRSGTLGEQIYACGMGFNPAISHGEYWRLVTPIFLHGNYLTHVLFNSFSLVLFGPALEQMLGKFKFIILYFVAGIIGNIGTFLVDPGMLNPHIGASGAIYGIFGLYLFMVVFRKHLMDYASTRIVIIILVIGLVMTFIRPGINISAHIFGFIGGFATGPLILNNVQPFSPWRNQPRHRNSDDNPHFNPNRWKRRRVRMNPEVIKKIIWTVIGILIAAGVLSAMGII
ncbi:MAG TPA: rhomboid family intramembrane serine protease [Bacillota bacterium]|nr:rhomboid family intramembrane serine protease [Bacillota bacterium]